MALIDKIFGTKKTLSELSRQELRREEILLTKQRERLFKRIVMETPAPIGLGPELQGRVAV